ncbi:hypothetical protein WAI453_010222 [Rhynchosporium graminicola]
MPKDRKPLTTKWTFRKKLGGEGEITRYKARMVARGFQQIEGFDFTETYSNVVKAASYRILFAMTALYGWHCYQIDITTAFLNGDIDEEIYIRAPEGYPESHGIKASEYDECVFIKQNPLLIITVYVDDINIFGPALSTIRDFMQQISSKFPITGGDPVSYYLGMKVTQTRSGLHIGQSVYTRQILNRFGMTPTKPSPIPLDPSAKLTQEKSALASTSFRHQFLSKIGSINYNQTKTRPDIAFPVSYASRFGKNPNQSHMDAPNQILAYLSGTSTLGLNYSKEGSSKIEGWVDISTSSTHAEYVAASDATKEAVWLLGFFNELNKAMGKEIQPGIVLHIDNASALKITKNPEFHRRTKHIDIRYHYIRECVESGQIIPQWISGKENIADILTKPLARPQFSKLVKEMGLTEAPSAEEVTRARGSSRHVTFT